MAYLLDTNQWIYLLKGRSPSLAKKLDKVSPQEVRLCSVVKEELFYGAYKYPNREARLATLRQLFSRHTSVAFDDLSAKEAGRLRCELEKRGKVAGPHDLQIAAIALVQNWTLVTNNTAEFKNIENLKLEDWTRD